MSISPRMTPPSRRPRGKLTGAVLTTRPVCGHSLRIMRRFAAHAAALLFAAPVFLGPAAPSAAPQPAAPPEPYIVAMAQHFVQDRLMGTDTMYHIEFDNSFLYSQPRDNLWVVVGGYVSDQNIFNSFTAAVLLECPEFENVECWSLEKLSINGKIVLDRQRI
jgi:hypothetical protein